MIGISKLYCGQVEPSDALRYGRESGNLPSHLLQFSKDKKPVVVWNMTKRCNLKCVHCYAQAVPVDGADDISTEQAKTMIDDLAAYGAPVMLFSGGEPLVRKDLVELASHATSKGMRAVISTNGTLITKEKARELKGVGLSYVGISLDGMEEVHDRFRGVPGAFRKALEGVANCQAEGLKVGLRFTINKRNVGEIPGIFRLLADGYSVRQIGDALDILIFLGGKTQHKVEFYLIPAAAPVSTTWCTRAAVPSSSRKTWITPRPVRCWTSSWTRPAPCSTPASPKRSSPWTTTPTVPMCGCA